MQFADQTSVQAAPSEFPTGHDDIIKLVATIDPERYASTRNYLNGAVTRLSPYISRGALSGRNILEHLQARDTELPGVDRFIQQLAWREYFQRVWQHLGDEIFNDIRQPQAEVLKHSMPEALLSATTGVIAIDEQVKALQTTGYVHNHARMYTASIACNVGRYHWSTPASWMYFHLLDGDIASNTCSWQWVAGTFATKKYYFNQENLNKYAGFNQHGTFIDVSYEQLPRLQVPVQLASGIDLNLRTRLPSTQSPVIDPTKPTLIYNSYNLDPSWRSGEDVNRVLLLEPSHFNRFPVSEKVIDFVCRLGGNIPGIQVFAGEIDQLVSAYQATGYPTIIISKEHPAFRHYPGIKDSQEWIFEDLTDYYPSFNQFWKRASNTLLLRPLPGS